MLRNDANVATIVYFHGNAGEWVVVVVVVVVTVPSVVVSSHQPPNTLLPLSFPPPLPPPIGNMGFRLPNGVNMYQKLKCNVVLVDYRGYGHSEGKPSEVGLVKDAEAVLKMLREHPRIDK